MRTTEGQVNGSPLHPFEIEERPIRQRFIGAGSQAQAQGLVVVRKLCRKQEHHRQQGLVHSYGRARDASANQAPPGTQPCLNINIRLTAAMPARQVAL